MKYPIYQTFIHDFDTSILIVINNNLKLFKNSLKINSDWFEQIGIEVVLFADNFSTAKKLKEITDSYPFINWVIVDCRIDNLKTGYIDVINFYVKIRGKSFLVFMDATTQTPENVIFNLRYLSNYHTNSYFSILNKDCKNNIDKLNAVLFVKRDLFEKVQGFSKRFTRLCFAKRNLTAKFDLTKVHEISLKNTEIYYENIDISDRTNNYVYNLQQASKIIASDFSNKNKLTKIEIHCEHLNREYPKKQLLKFLKKEFICYDLNLKMYSKKKPIIALIQVYNESNNIKDLFKNLENVCDGIILLDDGSSDDTYAKAQSKILLLKARKERIEFNDLSNRNLLLKMARFFCGEWLFFIDADERFDHRYNDLRSIVRNSSKNVISFWLVNSWDKKDYYRTDLMDSVKYSQYGMFNRPRMFRNIGHFQILLNNSRKLHFSPVPLHKETSPENILIIHHGLERMADRLSKYQFYMQEDKDANREKTQYYNYLLDEEINIKKISDIQL